LSPLSARKYIVSNRIVSYRHFLCLSTYLW